MAMAIVGSHKNVNISSSNDVAEDLLWFSNIDDATKAWLSALWDMWDLWRKCEGVSRTLTEYFETAPNPYLSTLRILVNTPDFKNGKTSSSLAFTIAEEFSNWLLKGEENAYTDYLAADLKLAAFKLVNRQTNMQLIRLIAKTYKFMEDKELFLIMIEKMIADHAYKEAAQYATMLQLQTYFSNPEILLVPLILQNKLPILDEFLTDCPEVQMALITYLDDLIAPSNNMQNTLEGYIIERKITDVKISTVHVKPISKLLARLIKMHKHPPELCPNLSQRRSEGALQFLMHKRYFDRSLSTESWREMVREAVGTDSKLQLELLRLLVQVKDAQESLYWAQAYDIPQKQWPWATAYLYEQRETMVNDGASTSKDENWDSEENPVNYHVLSLERDCIILVDNQRSFMDFLDNGLKDVRVVGIDTEWKPSFGTKSTELALIQIATETHVYILDVTTLGNETPELWAELGLVLFENKHILKLGFGTSHDIAVIRDAITTLSKIKACGEGYLDVLHLWKKLVQEYGFTFPYKGDETFKNNSLSKLVELCVGQRLNKSDQFSNWEQRPLRESQITYAALDAYCLLEVYEVFAAQSMEMEIPFQEICMEIRHIPQKSPKKAIKKHVPQTNAGHHPQTETVRKENSQKQKSFHPPWYKHRQINSANMETNVLKTNSTEENCKKFIPAHNWRVLCDSMLGALAGKLRMCGIDCRHMLMQDAVQSANIAKHERRIVLTAEKEYQRLLQYLPRNTCYNVTARTTDTQLREVLTHFNVRLTKKDILSRCRFCNNDEFVQISANIMDKLVKSFINATRGKSYRTHPDPYHITNANMITDNKRNCNISSHAQISNVHERAWQLRTNTLDMRTCTTRYRMRVQVDKVPLHVLKNVLLFYICEHCGTVYWDDLLIEKMLISLIKDLIVDE